MFFLVLLQIPEDSTTASADSAFCDEIRYEDFESLSDRATA